MSELADKAESLEIQVALLEDPETVLERVLRSGQETDAQRQVRQILQQECQRIIIRPRITAHRTALIPDQRPPQPPPQSQIPNDPQIPRLILLIKPPPLINLLILLLQVMDVGTVSVDLSVPQLQFF